MTTPTAPTPIITTTLDRVSTLVLTPIATPTPDVEPSTMVVCNRCGKCVEKKLSFSIRDGHQCSMKCMQAMRDKFLAEEEEKEKGKTRFVSSFNYLGGGSRCT